jgi:hypothetical protein
LRGYDERSFVRASVSRLARLRPGYAVRGGVSMPEFSDSIWKGKEPSPDDAVDMLEPVDKPSIRRFGGGGSGSSSLSDTVMLLESRLNDWCLVNDGAAKVLVGVEVPLEVKDCLDNGETGGDLIGRSDIGEGGTKGNDSRMESARVDVADKTEDPETLLISRS